MLKLDINKSLCTLIPLSIDNFCCETFSMIFYYTHYHRHGRKHTATPTNVNYRANLYALKQEGCTHVFVTTACGSLAEEVEPGDIVIIDSFIDR